MKVEIELPEIKDYKYTGEWRKPKNNEWFLDVHKSVCKAVDNSIIQKYLILKKIIEKEKLTKTQIINEVLWDPNAKISFRVISFENYKCWKNIRGQDVETSFECIQTYCELYDGQDKE